MTEKRTKVTDIFFEKSGHSRAGYPDIAPETPRQVIPQLHNYFGLPAHSVQSTPGSLVYRCRAVISGIDDEAAESESARFSPGLIASADNAFEVLMTEETAKNESKLKSQRKVASSLLKMVESESMAPLFFKKGGLEALISFVEEVKDKYVLLICAKCFQLASTKPNLGKLLIEKSTLPSVQTLADNPDPEIKFLCIQFMANMSMMQKRLEEKLAMSGAFNVVQTLMTASGDNIIWVCYLLLTLNNMAMSLQAGESEVASRMFIRAAKKSLNFIGNYTHALFLSKIFCNISRVYHFVVSLCEEGIVGVLLSILDAHPKRLIMSYVSETFSNLTSSRKNRREVASSGFANHLDLVFNKGDANARGHTLTAMGNMLNSNYLHDKIAKDDVIKNFFVVLPVLFDPSYPRQFKAAAFCISQLASKDTCKALLVNCGIIPLMLQHLTDSPPDAIEYVWQVLIDISRDVSFFENIMEHRASLFHLLYGFIDHAVSYIRRMRAESGMAIKAPTTQLQVLHFINNIAIRPELVHFVTPGTLDIFVRTLKNIIRAPLPISMKEMIMESILHLCANVTSCRPLFLSDDLLKLFKSSRTSFSDEEDEDFRDNATPDDSDAGPEWAASTCHITILNLLSCEEALCSKLLEMGIHSYLVKVARVFMPTKESAERRSLVFMRAQVEALNMAVRPSMTFHTSEDLLSPFAALKNVVAPNTSTIITAESIELAYGLIAATVCNLSLRRATLGSGLASLVLSLIRNTKSLRVFHGVQCLANASCHAKARVLLSKEKDIIGVLTRIMRCGCEEADRVQYFSSVIICNLTASKFDAKQAEELIKDGTIVDLVVVTLLRVNAISTKESLAKALFNLLCPSDSRTALAIKLDVLSAIMELSKLESLELLEICSQTLYNVSCNIAPSKSGVSPDGLLYAQKFRSLKATSLLLNITTSRNSGAKPSSNIKSTCAMTLANISFDKTLAADLATDDRIAHTMFVLNSLNTEESCRCLAMSLFNLSLSSSCVAMANTSVVSLLASVIEKQLDASSSSFSLACVQHSMAALCNFSSYPAFHERLSTEAMSTALKVMSSAQVDMDTRTDGIKLVYNIVTVREESRVAAVAAGCISALCVFAKSQTDESMLTMVGRITKELCEEAGDDIIQRQLIKDGVMSLLLKLAKIEWPEMKLDVSCCLYYLTFGAEIMNVLKFGSIDILFWLTLYDCLGLHDTILRHVARSFLNFASDPAVAHAIVKEERFMAVLRNLAKSKNPGVLLVAAQIAYNLILAGGESRKTFMDRGAMQLIFDLAATNWSDVRRVCSSALHLVSDDLPSDPDVLALLLCLLEAEAGNEADEALGVKIRTPLVYSQAANVYTSFHKCNASNLQPSWLTLTCSLTTVFSPFPPAIPPAKLYATEEVAKEQANNDMAVVARGQHEKFVAADFKGFPPQGPWDDDEMLDADKMPPVKKKKKKKKKVEDYYSDYDDPAPVETSVTDDSSKTTLTGDLSIQSTGGRSPSKGRMSINNKSPSGVRSRRNSYQSPNRKMSLSLTVNSSLHSSESLQQQQQNQKPQQKRHAPRAPLITKHSIPENTVELLKKSSASPAAVNNKTSDRSFQRKNLSLFTSSGDVKR